MSGLSPAQRRTFAAVADAFLPVTPGAEPGAALSATGLGVHQRVDEMLANLPYESDRRALKLMLGLLGSRAGGLALYKSPRAFESLSPTAAEAALLAMGRSRRLFPRQVFGAMRRLVFALATTAREGERRSPTWDVMGYPGPLGDPPDVPRTLVPAHVESTATWTCDVVVVGSGAGGGTAAGVLAEAGLDVVVLERGGYYAERDFTHRQGEADRDLFETRVTGDLGIVMMSGRCLGGGTVVNYSTSLVTPDHVRREWDREAGFRGVFEGAEYARSLEAVSERLGVNTSQSTPALRDRVIEEACAKLGWGSRPLPRNVRGCPQDERCGYCSMGCRLGAKQSTARTWLEDAQERGARLVVRAEAQRVLMDGGRAVGVRTKVTRPDGTRVTLTVFGKAVVVACGALYTPELLRRSGLRMPALGEHLRLHPATTVWGRFAARAEPWGGVMQARIGDRFADLDGRGYGVRFESLAAHPLEFSILQGWGGGTDVKNLLRTYPTWVPIAVLLRDRGAGRVRARRVGKTNYDYEIGAVDRAHVREGMRRAAEALAAAGALEVRAATPVATSWRPTGGERLDAFVARLDGAGYGACQTTYASLHQMGSARMGASSKTSVVDEENQVHGVPGLYVLDASCFPTASGVNPMLSIEAIAHRGARAIAGTLGRE